MNKGPLIMPLDPRLAERYNIAEEPEYEGYFTRDQADGAIPNGSRVIKTANIGSDMSPEGATGVVLGSIYHSMVGYGYFIEWDHAPRKAVFISAYKIRQTPNQ